MTVEAAGGTPPPLEETTCLVLRGFAHIKELPLWGIHVPHVLPPGHFVRTNHLLLVPGPTPVLNLIPVTRSTNIRHMQANNFAPRRRQYGCTRMLAKSIVDKYTMIAVGPCHEELGGRKRYTFVPGSLKK